MDAFNNFLSTKKQTTAWLFGLIILAAPPMQANLSVVKTLDGYGPSVAVNRTTNRVYAGTQEIDGEGHVPSGEIAGVTSIQAVDEVTNQLYGTAYDVNLDLTRLAIVDGNTKSVTMTEEVLGRGPDSRGADIAVNPGLARVYIADDQLTVLDSTTRQVVTRISTATDRAGDVAVNTRTNDVFTTEAATGLLRVFNGTTNVRQAALQVTGAASSGLLELAVNETDNLVFVINSQEQTLTVVDGRTYRIVNRVSLPFAPAGVAVNESNRQIYVTGPGSIVSIDSATLSLGTIINIDVSPFDIVDNDRTHFVYVSGQVLNSTATRLVVLQDDVVPSADTTPPNLTLTSPSNGAKLSTLPNISGTVGDNRGGSGLDRVALFLRRSSDGRYWSGRNWATTAIELPARLEGNTFTHAFDLPTGTNLRADTYFITAIALDRAQPRANRTVVVSSVRIIDTAAPQVAFAYPVNGQQVTQLFKVQGTIADTEGGSGPSRVLLFIRRLSDGKYFDGTRWVTAAIALPTRLSGTGREVAWIYAGQLPAAVSQRDLYRLTAVGYDRAFNRSLSEVQVQSGSAPTTT